MALYSRVNRVRAALLAMIACGDLSPWGSQVGSYKSRAHCESGLVWSSNCLETPWRENAKKEAISLLSIRGNHWTKPGEKYIAKRSISAVWGGTRGD